MGTATRYMPRHIVHTKFRRSHQWDIAEPFLDDSTVVSTTPTCTGARKRVDEQNLPVDDASGPVYVAKRPRRMFQTLSDNIKSSRAVVAVPEVPRPLDW